jgi:hypothetical protein
LDFRITINYVKQVLKRKSWDIVYPIITQGKFGRQRGLGEMANRVIAEEIEGDNIAQINSPLIKIDILEEERFLKLTHSLTKRELWKTSQFLKMVFKKGAEHLIQVSDNALLNVPFQKLKQHLEPKIQILQDLNDLVDNMIFFKSDELCKSEVEYFLTNDGWDNNMEDYKKSLQLAFPDHGEKAEKYIFNQSELKILNAADKLQEEISKDLGHFLILLKGLGKNMIWIQLMFNYKLWRMRV